MRHSTVQSLHGAYEHGFVPVDDTIGQGSRGMAVSLQDTQPEVLQVLLRQIARSLVYISGTIDRVDELPPNDTTAPVLRLRLEPHARVLETAMHRLREMGWARTPAATELSQSLTVLVLVADMLTSGQLSDVVEGCALLRRNAFRATACLYELRKQITWVL
jgi:hypothetical protein